MLAAALHADGRSTCPHLGEQVHQRAHAVFFCTVSKHWQAFENRLLPAKVFLCVCWRCLKVSACLPSTGCYLLRDQALIVLLRGHSLTFLPSGSCWLRGFTPVLQMVVMHECIPCLPAEGQWDGLLDTRGINYIATKVLVVPQGCLKHQTHEMDWRQLAQHACLHRMHCSDVAGIFQCYCGLAFV